MKYKTPDKQLERIRELIASEPGESGVVETFELVTELDNWLTGGGPLPEDWTRISSLFKHGYSVRYWLRLRDSHLVLEYRPYPSPHPPHPRVTADTYERQVAIHRALGIGVVGPGRDWVDHGAGQMDLFSAMGVAG